MPSRPPHRVPTGTRVRGLSLLEMLLVVALIAIIGVVTATAMNGGIDGMRLRNAGKEIATQLRYTRTQAIATGQTQRFVIDPRARTWQAAHAFCADGAARGGSIDLGPRGAVWEIHVGWITGEVRAGPRREGG